MRLLPVIIAFLALCAGPRLASANRSVGVLVTGQYLKTPTQQQAEKWLRDKQLKVVTTPMPTDAVKTLLDCFVLDDPKCMRSVVDARSTTDSLVSIRIDIASKKQREIRVTIDWFAKGYSPITSRRNCDKCTEDVLRQTIDSMLEDLAKTAPGFNGQLKITSDPAGLMVMMDNETIGVTPVDRTVPLGSHTLRVVRDGRMGPEQTIDVEAGDPIDVTLVAPAAEATPVRDENPLPEKPAPRTGRRSRLFPGLLIGVGVAGIGAGAALYLTSEEPDGSGRTYRDTKKLGIGVAAGGGALLLTGVIIILATRSTTGPTVSVTPGGASLGWAGSF